jgi:Cu/Ag efflux pump CusA
MLRSKFGAPSLVFFPVLNMSGLAGIAYIWAILASLVVTLSVTPAICMLLLGDRDLPPQEPSAVHWLKKGYHELLLGVERVPKLLMTGVALFIALGVGALFFLSESFLPELREGNITIHMTAVPGTSLQESLRMGDRITEAVLKIPSVQSVAQRAGRAELGTETLIR